MTWVIRRKNDMRSRAGKSGLFLTKGIVNQFTWKAMCDYDTKSRLIRFDSKKEADAKIKEITEEGYRYESMNEKEI